MQYRRILTIQDISCVGQCSMSVAFPILCAMGHETCMLPTAVLSTHTGGFSKPEVVHLADAMDRFWEHWSREGIRFDGICTGYLGSVGAAESVVKNAREFLNPGGELIVDPAMADHGRLYSGLTDAYAEAMHALCQTADIVIPNITEAAILSDNPWLESYDQEYIKKLLTDMGCTRIVLTGVAYNPAETGFDIWEDGAGSHYSQPRVPKSYHGTGDIFTACFAGMRVKGKPIWDCAVTAAEFTAEAIRHTWNNPSQGYGVQFEAILPKLVSRE